MLILLCVAAVILIFKEALTEHSKDIDTYGVYSHRMADDKHTFIISSGLHI